MGEYIDSFIDNWAMMCSMGLELKDNDLGYGG